MKQNYIDVYLKEKEPTKYYKSYAWKTAIGLQMVDGLETSEYLIKTAHKNINGEINFDEVSSMFYEDQVFAYAFYGCEKLKTASFKSLLSFSGNNVFQYAFANSGIENLYFYLSKNGTLSSNSFSNMLNGVNGCTIHFPANLNGATKISSLSGYPNFGGTNTVLAYDLPNIMKLNNMYIRHPAGDTDTASCWGTGVYPMTLFYTLGKTEPVIGDNIYSDSACTIVAYTVSSITEV